MAVSTSPNSLLAIKPNRFYSSRFRNTRWSPDMSTNTVDTGPVKANDLISAQDVTLAPPAINTDNETITRIKDRYNTV